jgi:hypothetical protein
MSRQEAQCHCPLAQEAAMSGESFSMGRDSSAPEVWNTGRADPLEATHVDSGWLPVADGSDAAITRPPRVWEAQPNLGRLWPMDTRTGAFVVF